MGQNVFIGIDIGTSAAKLAAFDEAGQMRFCDQQPYAIHHPHTGWAEQDPEDWWRAICAGLQSLWAQGCDPADVAAIGVDGQSWSAIPIDKDGQVLARTPIWMDTRAQATCDDWIERLGEERLFAVGGNPFSPTYTLPKLLHWMDTQPDLVARADALLQSNAFVVQRLTGALTMDLSQAYGWQNFDLTRMRYDEALTKELGVPERFLLEPVACDAVVGRVHARAAASTGLLEGTPVVAGGLDAACGTLGVGVIESGQTQEQGGQAGGMSICLDRPLPHPQLILGAHVVPERWLLQGGTVGGGASLQWFAKTLGAAREASDDLTRTAPDIFECLSREAESAPLGANGVVYLPYMAGERTPIWDPQASGAYVGLGFGTTHADFVRATMEGVAYALRHNIETALTTGATLTELRATGGSANSRIWTQIKANVTGLPMLVPASDTATTCGAAMLAMVGVGCHRDYREAVERIVTVRRSQAPDPNATAAYLPWYDVYKSLYPANRAAMHRLYALRSET